jgi:hypothetical protein
MTHVLLSVSEVLALAASFYGWGSLVHTWAGERNPAGWAYPSALGIAFLIAVGGLLNATGLARPLVLLPLLAMGLGMAILFASRLFWGRTESGPAAGRAPAGPAWQKVGNLIYYALLAAVFLFLVTTLMPSLTFNFHDDFHIYLMWPLRMLQTGSLGGNPFSHIGLSSLGGQSFMQGMFLTFGDLTDINGFDAILCLVLLLGLLKELGERLGVTIVFVLVSCILALVINPHYVNVSSLYSGSLMLLGLAYATLLLAESLGSADAAGRIRTAVPISLFLAALLSLKTTYVFVAPIFWIASLAGFLLLIKKRKKVLLVYASSAVFSIILLLPWLSIYVDRYLGKIQDFFGGVAYPKGKGFSVSPVVRRDVLSSLLSSKELFYGNTYRDYLILVVMLCAALAAAGTIVWRRRNKPETLALVPLLAILLSVIGNYLVYYEVTFFAAYLFVRYTCPLLIVAAPVAVLLAGWLWKEGNRLRQEKARGYGLPLVLGSLLLIFQFINMGMFRNTFLERIKRADDFGTLLSFPLALNPDYIKYN